MKDPKMFGDYSESEFFTNSVLNLNYLIPQI